MTDGVELPSRGRAYSGARLRRSPLGLAEGQPPEQPGELEQALDGPLPRDQPEVAEVLLAQAHAAQDRSQAGRVDEGEAAQVEHDLVRPLRAQPRGRRF